MTATKMIKGKIVKGIAGFYYVKSGEAIYRCKARGIFKERGIKLAVGDDVEFEILEDDENSLVTEVLPRRNSFIRPFVANVDCFCIVTAVARPAPVLATIDRFLVMAERAGTEIIICINKCDLADAGGKGAKAKAAGTLQMLKDIYEPIYPVVCLSNGKADDDDFARLKELIAGKTVALAGASGVGKSTLLNRLKPDAFMETGMVSNKTQRGKHTTRHSELFALDDGKDTMVFDTPGFTSFDILEAEEDELAHCYPDIARFAGKCRYDNCRHIAEPECAVKAALERGEIDPHRYESYKSQMEEIRRRK